MDFNFIASLIWKKNRLNRYYCSMMRHWQFQSGILGPTETCKISDGTDGTGIYLNLGLAAPGVGWINRLLQRKLSIGNRLFVNNISINILTPTATVAVINVIYVTKNSMPRSLKKIWKSWVFSITNDFKTKKVVRKLLHWYF